MAELTTTPAKGGRKKKSRKSLTPPLITRSDDVSGEMLERALALLCKRQKTMRLKPQHVAMPIWVIAPTDDADSAVVYEESAQTAGTPYYDYSLSLLELSDVYLKTQPLEIPKYSWMLAITRGEKSMRLVEGVATSRKQARERAESCWRIAVNAMPDG